MTIIFMSIPIFLSSLLASVVLIYAKRMSRSTRRLWAYNILFIMARQFLAILEKFTVFKRISFHDDLFKYLNYGLSVVVCVYFIFYIHKRYSYEQKEIDKIKLNEESC